VHRRQKLEALRERGVDPFGTRYPVTHWAGPLAARLGGAGEDELKGFRPVCVAGRIVSMRQPRQRRASPTLQDYTGRIQLYARADQLGDDFVHFTDVDLGDFVGVTGDMLRTRTGELTIAGQELHLPRKVAPAAAREVARPQGRGDALSAPVRRPHRQPGEPRGLHAPKPAHQGDP